MNSAVRPSFKVVFAGKSTCRFREPCMGPTEKQYKRAMQAQKRYPNSTYISTLNCILILFLHQNSEIWSCLHFRIQWQNKQWKWSCNVWKCRKWSWNLKISYILVLFKWICIFIWCFIIIKRFYNVKMVFEVSFGKMTIVELRHLLYSVLCVSTHKLVFHLTS